MRFRRRLRRPSSHPTTKPCSTPPSCSRVTKSPQPSTTSCVSVLVASCGLRAGACYVVGRLLSPRSHPCHLPVKSLSCPRHTLAVSRSWTMIVIPRILMPSAPWHRSLSRRVGGPHRQGRVHRVGAGGFRASRARRRLGQLGLTRSRPFTSVGHCHLASVTSFEPLAGGCEDQRLVGLYKLSVLKRTNKREVGRRISPSVSRRLGGEGRGSQWTTTGAGSRRQPRLDAHVCQRILTEHRHGPETGVVVSQPHGHVAAELQGLVQ